MELAARPYQQSFLQGAFSNVREQTGRTRNRSKPHELLFHKQCEQLSQLKQFKKSCKAGQNDPQGKVKDWNMENPINCSLLPWPVSLHCFVFRGTAFRPEACSLFLKGGGISHCMHHSPLNDNYFLFQVDLQAMCYGA